VKIVLDLSGHCIETELRSLYNRALSDCLKGVGDTHAEQIVEMTRYALERLDFGRLRSLYPPLAGRSRCRVILFVKDQGIGISIDDEPVQC
jgi:hypothetical protein